MDLSSPSSEARPESPGLVLASSKSQPKETWLTLLLLGLLLLVTTLNFGGTRPNGDLILTVGIALSLGLGWRTWRERQGSISLAAIPMTALLLLAISCSLWLAGWLQATGWPSFTTDHWAAIQRRWPDGIVSTSAGSKTWLILACSACIPGVALLARDDKGQQTILLSLVLSGCLASAIGILQSLSHAPGPLWCSSLKLCTNFAGPFYHHTMMGAFCNLCWPAALALGCRHWKRHNRLACLLCLLAAILILCGHACNVSRMPPLMAAVGIFLALGILLRGQTRTIQISVFILIPLTWVLAILALNAHTGKLTQISERWAGAIHDFQTDRPVITQADLWPENTWPEHMRDDLILDQTASSPKEIRLKLLLIGAHACQTRPFFGHGPANWTGAAATHSSDPLIRSFFQTVQFNHCDWLQMAVELGIPAGFAFMVLILGPLPLLFFKRKNSTQGQQLSALGVLLVGLQACWDFPLQAPALFFGISLLSGLLWAGLCSNTPSSLST